MIRPPNLMSYWAFRLIINPEPLSDIEQVEMERDAKRQALMNKLYFGSLFIFVALAGLTAILAAVVAIVQAN